ERLAFFMDLSLVSACAEKSRPRLLIAGLRSPALDRETPTAIISSFIRFLRVSGLKHARPFSSFTSATRGRSGKMRLITGISSQMLLRDLTKEKCSISSFGWRYSYSMRRVRWTLPRGFVLIRCISGRLTKRTFVKHEPKGAGLVRRKLLCSGQMPSIGGVADGIRPVAKDGPWYRCAARGGALLIPCSACHRPAHRFR